jgi:hypothetical protein
VWKASIHSLSLVLSTDVITAQKLTRGEAIGHVANLAPNDEGASVGENRVCKTRVQITGLQGERVRMGNAVARVSSLAVGGRRSSSSLTLARRT